jgi:hypothetical protein
MRDQRRERQGRRLPVRLGAGVLAGLACGAARADAPLCAPRVGEKLGVRFVEVCASSESEVFGGAYDRTLPPFWISAAPLPCSAGSHETVDCPTLTPLEASPVGSPLRNRPMRAAVVDAATAHRLCTLRFGGRLPTEAEREQARHVLGLVTLLVREGAGPGPSVELDELPEWAATRECAASPSNLGPGCRVSLSPPVIVRPRRAGDSLLACDAELADFGPEPSVGPGGTCGAALDSELRQPRCAVVVPHAAYPSRFTLACRPVPEAPGEADARPSDALAPFRCVLPEAALGSRSEPRGSRAPPRAPPEPPRR